MSITLPKPPEPDTWDKRYSPALLRARDLEIARVVLEAAAQSAALWHANGIESEIAREIRALEVRHHE